MTGGRGRWTSPPNDSRPELSPVERESLASVISRIGRSRTRLDQFPAETHRLLRPPQDVLDHTGANGHVRVNLFRVVAIQTHERQCSEWGWTHDEWVRLLNREHSEFAARYVTGDQ